MVDIGLQMDYFLGLSTPRQIKYFMELTVSEQEDVLREFADYIYDVQYDQYERGLRPEPFRQDIEPDYEAQQEKAQKEINLMRLKHYQELLKASYSNDVGLKQIKKFIEKDIEKSKAAGEDGVEIDGERVRFEDIHDGLIYEYAIGKKAFELACEVMDQARKYGLPHPDKYDLMLRIYPDIGRISDAAIIRNLLLDLKEEAGQIDFDRRILKNNKRGYGTLDKWL